MAMTKIPPRLEPRAFAEPIRVWPTVLAVGVILALVLSVTVAIRGGGRSVMTTGAAFDPADATIDQNAAAPDDFVARDPAVAPAPAATVHRIALDATETVTEVAPGMRQEMWTFGGTAPGPMLRGKVGDVFEITLTNKGKFPHSIDFHSSKVAPNVEMRTIGAGESLVYRFEAKHAGMFMYHCSTAPALHHIGNGMYGAMIVDPPGLAPVDQELAFVQSELYLGPEGKFGDPRWCSTGTSTGGAQALDLQPAQGGFVEFTFDAPGAYPFVTHKFANVGRGALGVFQVGEGPATASH